MWRLLRDDPDRYIYPAVGHGITWNARDVQNPSRLDSPFELPDEITAGIDDMSKRGGWNRPAPDDYALPTEIWREVVARRQRHAEVRAKLAAGEVQEINDLITLNLDIEQFARDVIAQSEGPELLRAFWHAMRDVSVLDPTCGSGAFLFAALNILEPLYTACLEGMQGFVDDLERTDRPHSPKALSDFKEVLEQVDEHPSERYFILKSIVLNNLYGVDIMEEAVEICKLRLFLKLVAQLKTYDQIEPLPDIDFNIRAGNTLVGFTSLDAVRQAMTMMPNGQRRQVFPEEQATLDRIEEEARGVDWMSHEFRRQQTMLGGEVTSGDKEALRQRLHSLADEMDRLMAIDYGVDLTTDADYDDWRASHQPFHWFAEFYGIMSNGGFDVVIGNPPYVEYTKVKQQYTIRGFYTEPSRDLYAYCAERALAMNLNSGRIGVILPISSFGLNRFKTLQETVLKKVGRLWVSNFGVRPQHLFDGVDKRLSIVLGEHEYNKPTVIHTSKYIRWGRDEYDFLFQTQLAYTRVHTAFSVLPNSLEKIGTEIEANAFSKLASFYTQGGHTASKVTPHLIYYTRNFGYFLVFLDFVPNVFDISTGEVKKPSELKSIAHESRKDVLTTVSVLNSSTFYWFCNVLSDCRNLNRREILAFPFYSRQVSKPIRATLARLGNRFLEQLKVTSSVLKKSSLRIETFEYRECKPIADEIDRVLAKYFGLTEEELDFIINFDIKYRMGKSNS